MKRYLSIGLNYAKTPYRLLDCEMDAMAIQQVAIQAGYSGAALFQCSASEFISQINDIRDNARHGDTTLISFSGHGTQWDGGGENDRMEEGLCFWNGNGIEVMQDNDFRALINTIPGTVYVFLDSCFSGGMARSLRGRPKLSGSWSGRFVQFDNDFRMVDCGSETTPRLLLTNRQYYLLACSESEVSWSTGTGGLFTKTFLEKYRTAKSRTIKNIMSLTRKDCHPDQTPIWEIFGGAASKKIF